MSSRLEKILTEKIVNEVAAKGGLAAFTPGLKIQVVQSGRLKVSLEMGETFQYYDLASLTKVIFATTAMMRLVDTNRIHIGKGKAAGDRVRQHLPWWPHRQTTAVNVLSHSAGLSAWAPIYKEIRKRGLKSHSAKYDFLQKFLARQKLARSKKAVYSDLDFLLLGFLIEEGFGRSLLDCWHHLGLQTEMSSLHFCVNNRPVHSRQQYAPTEKCPWRKKILRGEVHDDNTWALGGVSSHAGLFGSIDDVTHFGQLLRRGFYGARQSLAAPETIQHFVRRAIDRKWGDWALGFMMPTSGSASCGRYFSSSSVGHTGFTGTSLWFDPKRDLLVTILSNRVHPTRDNRNFVALRPRLHDLIAESL